VAVGLARTIDHFRQKLEIAVAPAASAGRRALGYANAGPVILRPATAMPGSD
jgi:hypothetical protein